MPPPESRGVTSAARLPSCRPAVCRPVESGGRRTRRGRGGANSISPASRHCNPCPDSRLHHTGPGRTGKVHPIRIMTVKTTQNNLAQCAQKRSSTFSGLQVLKPTILLQGQVKIIHETTLSTRCLFGCIEVGGPTVPSSGFPMNVFSLCRGSSCCGWLILIKFNTDFLQRESFSSSESFPWLPCNLMCHNNKV